MFQALGGFIVGAFCATLLFFFAPGLLDDFQSFNWHFGGHERDEGIVVGLAQPFAMIANDNSLSDGDVYDDTPSSTCQGVLAIENRSDHPMSVSLAIHYRDGGRSGGNDTLTLVDGSDAVEVAPGAEIDRAVREDHLAGSRRDCEALNQPGVLVAQTQTCPEDASSGAGDCQEQEFDPGESGLPSRDQGPSPGQGPSGGGDTYGPPPQNSAPGRGSSTAG